MDSGRVLRSASKSCVSHHRESDGNITVLGTYDDEILITRNDEAGVRKMGECHSSKHYERDVGVPDHFVGISVRGTERSISLDQWRYIERTVLEGFGSTDTRHDYTPLVPGLNLSVG